ncbi:MAG: beta strand repeat-containing protein, partial [Bdellovibrionia bacterium]
MQYVTTFPQMNSGKISSCLNRWLRRASLCLNVLIAAAALSSCNVAGGPASTSDNTDPGKLAPGTINYSRNPAYYPYNSAISPNVLNSTGTITSATISPALPTGLVFNATNGTISGTPTTITPAQAYTVRATNAQGTSFVTLNLAITDQPPVMTYGGTKTLVFVKDGSAISDINLTLSGGPVTTCNASPALPAGLAVNAQCNKISGTPTAVASAKDYTITASNSGGSSSLVFNFTVKDIAPIINYSPSGNSLKRGQAMTAWAPSSTGGAVVSCSSAPSLPAGLTLSSTCQITGTPTATQASTPYTITATNSGGTNSTVINIDVQEPQPNISYVPNHRSITKGQASTINVTNTGGVPDTCTPDTSLPTGLSISTSCNITGTPTTLTTGWTGNITAVNAAGSSSTTLIIDVVDVPPNISYTGSPYTFNAEFPITTQTPTNTGGPITSCSASPTLPTGLSISNTTCAISGTPTTAQTAKTYTITASNSGGSRTATISITVQTVAPSITYTGSPYTYTKGTLITNATPANAGGTPTSCTSSPTLPAGLSISSTCVISGTPTSVATATNYTVTATNAAGSSTALVNITVKDVLPSFSYSGGPYVYTNGTPISTLTPTNTGGAIVSCSSSPTLPAGLSLANDCQITGTPTVPVAATNYTISGTNSGGTATTSINITVNDVAPTISYAGSPFNYTKGSAISALSPTVTGGALTSCTVSPTLPTGLSLSNTCVLTGTPTALSAATNYTITGSNSGGSSNATINISVTSLAPIISYTGSPFVYTKGSAITTLTPSNSGGAINSCSSDNTLPAGLTLSSTCVLSGTPTAVKAALDYTITATNANGSSAATINITVKDVAPAIDYIPTSYSFTYTKGSAISPLTPNNNGGTITSCTASPALPAGLSINSTTCTISGTPSGVQGSTTYSITASNTGGSSSATITITVNDTAPIFSYSGGPFSTTVNTALTTLTPTSSGGTITSCSASPGLPGGVSLSNTCVISGTPTVVTAATNYTITAVNTGGSVSTTINLQIKDVAPTLNYTGSPFTYTQGVAITTLNPTNTGGAITSCSSSPTLPNGLSLSSTCVLSGASTVTVAATNYTITASNSGGTASKTISITVNPGPPVLSYSGTPYAFVKNTSIGTVNPTNTGGAITSCSSSPGLPAGLSLSADCIITGTPTVASSATNYTITGTNVQGSSSYTISIKVDDSAPSIGFTPSSYVETLRTTITNIAPANSGGAITSCTSTPALPGGLSLSSSCVISGTPTVVSAATNFTITASNIFGSASAVVNIRVKNLPKIVFYSKIPLNGATNGTATGSSNIWTVTVDGVDKVALTQNTSTGLTSETPNFSLDGTHIAYHSKRALNGNTNGTATSSFNLWNMLSDGTSAIHPTSNTLAGLNSTSPVSDGTSAFPVTGDESPRFSPDGTKIVFASKMALSGAADGTATGSYNIWIVNADGSGLTHLTANTLSSRDSIQPVFGSNSSVVYFVSKTAQDGSDNGTATSSYNVWKVNTDGTGRTPLTAYTAAGFDCYDVAVSPDGTKLAYASHAYTTTGTSDSNINIWTMGTNGAGNTRLTANSTGVRDSRYPSFSPDGSEIVFSSLMRISGITTSSYNIWKMSSSGANQVALTTNTGTANDSIYPVFSPDSTMIAFASKLDVGVTSAGSYNIWVMKSDGTGLNYLTANTN